MKKTERINFVISTLDSLYPDPKPFLKANNAFCFLVAVLLSARCTDSKVNSITPRLFNLADSSKKMFGLGSSLIKEIIKPCGLSGRKSKAIFGLSEILMTDYGEGIPSRLDDLIKLPGVGRKTALVVIGTIFGTPVFPVDTHIFRCARRWGFSEKTSVNGVEKDLCSIFSRDIWLRLHLQMISFGREYCKAVRHDKCPICSSYQRT